MTKTTCFHIITLPRNSTFEAFKYGAQCPISGKRNSNVAIATSLILGKDSEVLNWTASTCSKSVTSCACIIGLLWKLHVQTLGYIWVMEVLHDSHTVVLDVRTQGQQRKPPPSTDLTKKQTNFVALKLTLWSIQQPWATWLDDTRGSIHCTQLSAFCWVIPFTSKIHLAGKEGSTERQSSMWMPTCEVLTIWIKTSVSGTNSTHQWRSLPVFSLDQHPLSNSSVQNPPTEAKVC